MPFNKKEHPFVQRQIDLPEHPGPHTADCAAGQTQNNITWTPADDVGLHLECDGSYNLAALILVVLYLRPLANHHQVGFRHQIFHGIGAHRGRQRLPATQNRHDRDGCAESP